MKKIALQKLLFVPVLMFIFSHARAEAGSLTAAQRTTLKSFIQADATLGPLATAKQYDTIATSLNMDAAPSFWVWKTTVTKDDCVNQTSVDGTTFSWTGTGFITRAVGERDAWRELFSVNGTVNPSLPNVRQAFSDIFSGATAPAPANRTHLLAIARRTANVTEKLFATGTGSTAVPGLLVFEGTVTGQLVSDVLGGL